MMLRVSDIKQYMYCPRIIYFTYVTPVDKKVTPKMEYGKLEHIELDRLEKRRKLREYGLREGERRFHTFLSSERLGLNGLLDMHIVVGKDYFPVEFKNSTRRPGINHKYQLIAYAMLLEEACARPVRAGFFYMIPHKKIYPLEITPNVRDFTRSIMKKIHAIINEGVFPPAPRRPARCFDCEYRNFCGDVI